MVPFPELKNIFTKINIAVNHLIVCTSSNLIMYLSERNAKNVQDKKRLLFGLTEYIYKGYIPFGSNNLRQRNLRQGDDDR